MTLIPEDVARRLIHRAALLALGCGVLYGVVLMHWLHQPAVAVADPRMEAGCHWPRHEGEMTVAAVYEGRVVCWRWR